MENEEVYKQLKNEITRYLKDRYIVEVVKKSGERNYFFADKLFMIGFKHNREKLSLPTVEEINFYKIENVKIGDVKIELTKLDIDSRLFKEIMKELV